jgi:hypothetical protein
MKFWTGIYKSDFHKQLAAGVGVILAAAHRVLATQKKNNPDGSVPQIEGAGGGVEENDEQP